MKAPRALKECKVRKAQLVFRVLKACRVYKAPRDFKDRSVRKARLDVTVTSVVRHSTTRMTQVLHHTCQTTHLLVNYALIMVR